MRSRKPTRNASRPSRRQKPAPSAARPRRQGVAVLVVMLLIAITLGLSYAMIRSQNTALRIQQNAGVRGSARRAALTGLTIALKKMHAGDWCYGEGVNATLSAAIGQHASFQVTYRVGDPSLAVTDPDYVYRVTLLAAGTATDPADSTRTATHRARAVVRLVPRSVAKEPTDWAAMQKYTLYQSKRDSFEIDIPCRLEGPVRAQSKVEIAKHYPNDNNAWSRYLRDLNAMRVAGRPDYRPFSGPVDLPFLDQSAAHLFALASELRVPVNDTPPSEVAADWMQPGSFTHYQIYPGGAVYTVPWSGTTLENTTLEPDPETNPLGLYYRSGDVTIRDNVTIQGSFFCSHDIRIEGKNVHFKPVPLLGLSGSEAPLRLPVATCHRFVVKPTAGGSLTGLAAVFEELSIDKSPDTVEFAVAGRVITRKFFIKERQPWETLDWSRHYSDFLMQLGGTEGPVVPHFPVFMAYRGCDPKPLLTIKPDPSPVTYHWIRPDDPIYVPHPDDDGLRWDLVEWTDRL